MKQLTLAWQIEEPLSPELDQALEWIDPCLQQACVLEELPNVEISLLIVSNQRIQQLNAAYRQVNRPTDVLSFPLWEVEELREEPWRQLEEPFPLGDIVISVEKVREQAIQYGHSLAREFGFLVTHGLLHLLGYDHENESDEKVMIQRQNEILQQVGLGR